MYMKDLLVFSNVKNIVFGGALCVCLVLKTALHLQDQLWPRSYDLGQKVQYFKTLMGYCTVLIHRNEIGWHFELNFPLEPLSSPRCPISNVATTSKQELTNILAESRFLPSWNPIVPQTTLCELLN